MSEISANLKNLFWPPKPPILKVEVGFFSDKKSFSQIFENRIFFFHLKFISIKKKKIREPFFIGQEVAHSPGGILIFIFQKKTPWRTCDVRVTYALFTGGNLIKKVKKSENIFREVGREGTHYHALRAWPARWGVSQLGTLDAHGFNTERARLGGGTSLLTA